MSKWQIVKQTKFVEGVPVECDAKPVRFARIVDKKTKEERFIRLRGVLIRVLFKHEREQAWEFWKVTYRPGKGYNITCPDRKERVSSNPFETDTKLVKGNRFRKGTNTSGTKELPGFIEEMRAINVDDDFIVRIVELIDAEIDALTNGSEAEEELGAAA